MDKNILGITELNHGKEKIKEILYKPSSKAEYKN